MKEKTYTEKEVVMLITELMMDHFGDEWIPQQDEGFLDWLIKENLYDTFDKFYNK